jgi:hypothetical protein
MYYGLHSHFLILHFALTIDQKQASTHHRIFVHPQNFLNDLPLSKNKIAKSKKSKINFALMLANKQERR